MKKNVKSVEPKKAGPIQRKVKAIAAAGALGVATMFGANACEHVVHDIEYVYPIPEFKHIIKIDDYTITDTDTKNWIIDVGQSLITNDNGSIAKQIRYDCRSPIFIYNDELSINNKCQSTPNGAIVIDNNIDNETIFKDNLNAAIIIYISQNTL